MSAVRTVRLLDRRPGEPADETKEVAGIVIERHVPLAAIPHRPPAPIIQALRALEVGESFVWASQAKDQRLRVQSTHPGRGFASRKLPDGRFRIWRTK